MLLKVYIVVIVTIVLVYDVTAKGSGKGRKGKGKGKGKGSSSSSELLSSEYSSSEELENWYEDLEYQELLDLVCSENFNTLFPEDGCKFETERIPEMRTVIPSLLSIDVGTCPFGSCSNRTYCPHDGYICSQTATGIADFEPLGSIEYEYVTKCVCCKDEGLQVLVNVFDSDTGAEVGDVEIRINSIYKGVTDDDGFVEVTTETSARLVIRAMPDYRFYHDAVRVLDIEPSSRAPVEVNLYVIKMAEFVEIQSGEPYTFPLNTPSGAASIEIAAGSFKYVNTPGKSVGFVYASITFLDSNTVAEELLPGIFLNENGQLLVSHGIFAFYFVDSDGEELEAEQIELTLEYGMVPWELNTETGRWIRVFDLADRRKRQVSEETFLLNIGNHAWINIDQLYNAPLCYFKARIFNETRRDEEITSSPTATFKPEIIAYTNDNKRLRMPLSSTNSTSDTCFAFPCPDANLPSYPMVGYINMSSTETVLIGSGHFRYKTYMQPRNLLDYSSTDTQNKHTDVGYEIADNNLDIYANFISNAEGPFYTTMDDCVTSTPQQPAFHFFKPPVPNYQPVSSDIDKCFARIAFKDSGNFVDYLSTLGNLPSVTGVSTWTNYIYLNTAQLQAVTAGDDFAFACLEYRCSAANDLTTVYLDIAVPNITLSNGDAKPAFTCRGQCRGNFCNNNQDNPDVSAISFNVSFTPPVNIAAPSFFNALTDCMAEPSPDEFAYAFQCIKQEEDTSGQ